MSIKQLTIKEITIIHKDIAALRKNAIYSFVILKKVCKSCYKTKEILQIEIVSHIY